MKNIYFIILALLIILYIFISIRKNRLSVNNCTIWILFCIAVLFFSVWPKSLDGVANIIGIDYPPALFLTIVVIILFIQNFIYSKKIDTLQKKVMDLAQEVSIVKEKSNEKK